MFSDRNRRKVADVPPSLRHDHHPTPPSITTPAQRRPRPPLPKPSQAPPNPTQSQPHHIPVLRPFHSLQGPISPPYSHHSGRRAHTPSAGSTSPPFSPSSTDRLRRPLHLNLLRYPLFGRIFRMRKAFPVVPHSYPAHVSKSHIGYSLAYRSLREKYTSHGLRRVAAILAPNWAKRQGRPRADGPGARPSLRIRGETPAT